MGCLPLNSKFHFAKLAIKAKLDTNYLLTFFQRRQTSERHFQAYRLSFISTSAMTGAQPKLEFTMLSGLALSSPRMGVDFASISVPQTPVVQKSFFSLQAFKSLSPRPCSSMPATAADSFDSALKNKPEPFFEDICCSSSPSPRRQTVVRVLPPSRYLSATGSGKIDYRPTLNDYQSAYVFRKRQSV